MICDVRSGIWLSIPLKLCAALSTGGGFPKPMGLGV